MPPSPARVTASAASGQRSSLSELVEETRRVVIAAMESVPEGFSVPLKIEIKAGRRWAECK
jgi:DNA polymerase I-like protein with 3'-5' exonuclease and polymerase domains